tara:strand:- start:11 stop:451 length:441 start_codon:yes stop_codon:yes gene_type:complete
VKTVSAKNEPKNSEPKVILLLAEQHLVKMFVLNKPCKSITKLYLVLLNILTKLKNNLKNKKYFFLFSTIIQSVFGHEITFSIKGSDLTNCSNLLSINHVISHFGNVFFMARTIGRQKIISPMEEVLIKRILILLYPKLINYHLVKF